MISGTAASQQSDGQPPLLVRLVAIDWYMAPPLPGLDVCFSFFEGTAIQQVPVVRIFGSTPAGQKACVHLHKVCARHCASCLTC
jgi:DNA polymerase zeta